MFDIGWSELAIIAAVAILVIGPKDLPLALKMVGQWMGKARALAREFQGSVDEMIREAEIDKLKKDVEEAATKLDVTKEIEDTTRELEKSLEMPSIEMNPLGDERGAAAEKPQESAHPPPPDAPAMPLPSQMAPELAAESPPAGSPTVDKPPAEPAAEERKTAAEAPPPRAAGGQF